MLWTSWACCTGSSQSGATNCCGRLPERHLVIDGPPAFGGLFDFGLYFFHCVPRLLAHGSGPYFYLPKLESHLEARLWNDVFCLAQDCLGVDRGTIKATVLIET